MAVGRQPQLKNKPTRPAGRKEDHYRRTYWRDQVRPIIFQLQKEKLYRWISRIFLPH